MERPRGALRLLGTTFDLYWRFPLLFLILAGAVVIPYQLIVLVVTGNGPFGAQNDGFVVSQILTLTQIGLVAPLVSALHVHAVREIRDGHMPRLPEIARQGLIALPAVSAAAVISYLGAVAGLVALIVPGVLLYLRWSVVAQAAALDGKGWKAALRRSADLTREKYPHVFALQFCVVAFSTIGFAIGRAFRHDTVATSFVVDTALVVVVASFGALVTALLYFDLKARLDAERAARSAEAHPSPTSLDPGDQSDENRPPGWYVDPDRPRRMRYWAADGTPTWSKRTAKTPKAMRAEWKRERS